MKIACTLSKAQADALFSANAVMMGGRDVIFDYKVADLFGPDVCAWAESCMSFKGFLAAGSDFSIWGSGPFHYFSKSGFDKLVSQHNYRIGVSEYNSSEGGAIWELLWAARSASIAAQDAEDQQRREDAKAKRAAARKAKQEASAQAAQEPTKQPVSVSANLHPR